MHIKQGKLPNASLLGRWVRASFNRLVLPVLSRTLFRITTSKNDAIYHSLFAISTKRTSSF